MNEVHQRYNTIEYISKRRWVSYWHQIHEVFMCHNIVTILEIGAGNNIVSGVLKDLGYAVKTLDVDSNTRPDYIADARNLEKAVSNSFDCILCCQVLEHIPFDDVPDLLRQIYNRSDKFLVATLPYTSLGTFKPHVVIKLLPFLKPFRWIKIFDVFPKKHHLNRPGGHHWEIGKKGYPLKKILRLFEDTGWHIEKHYPIFENPYHYMLVCRKLV